MTESEHILEVYAELDRFLEEKTSGPDSDYAKNHVVAVGAINECLKQTVCNMLKHTTAFSGANDIDYSRLGLSNLSGELTVNKYTKFVFQEILDKSV